MPHVIQIRNVPDDVHAALAEAARTRDLSLTKYLLGELDQVARRAQVVRDNASIARAAQAKIRAHIDRDTILAAVHEGRGD